MVLGHATSAHGQNLSDAELECLLSSDQSIKSSTTCQGLEKRTRDTALAFFKESGYGDDYLGCYYFNLGESCDYLSDSMFEKDQSQTHLPSFLLRERACTLGYYDACDELLDEDIFKTFNLNTRQRLTVQACRFGGSDACDMAPMRDLTAEDYVPCLGLSKDEFMASPACIDIENKAKEIALLFAYGNYKEDEFIRCFDLERGKACTEFGTIRFVTAEDDLLELYAVQTVLENRACRLGEASTCRDMIVVLPIVLDMQAMNDAYDRLCSLGNQMACDANNAIKRGSQDKKPRSETYWAVDYFNSIRN